MKALKSVVISGKEVLPIIEGGKGINVSDGVTTGAFAAAGAVGTFSGVSCDNYDFDGNWKPENFKAKSWADRHEEHLEYAIKGGITQAQVAHEISGGEGRIHVNVLWEMGSCEAILKGILEGSKGLIHGVTCGAGMPYRLAPLASEYGVYYYPIVSSGRAFRALWRRSFKNHVDMLGGVVYEDPWCAGGHNGLSNSEDPANPQPPYPRVVELRKVMNAAGLNNIPIIMAGGLWFLREWQDWIDNPEIGPIAFQFGTRALLTQESPVANTWKDKLLSLKKGDVLLQKFSPTGFYSSAIKTRFLERLVERKASEIPYSEQSDPAYNQAVKLVSGRTVYIQAGMLERVTKAAAQGYDNILPTPEQTLVFLSTEEVKIFKQDAKDCVGCLSHCAFSGWSQHTETGTTGKKRDPRSFCIHKTLIDIGHGGPVENNTMFAGHAAYRFAQDPFYKDGNVPTVQELVDRIMTGD